MGIVVVATAIIGFGEYFRDFGLSIASIREKHLSDEHRDALLWTNVALGLILAIATWFGAAPLAGLFDIDALDAVLRALAVTFLINGVGAQYRAGLNRDRKFTQLAIADSVAPLLGLVCGVGTAVAGHGYWSLVAQFLVTAVVSNALAIWFHPWLPRLPARTPGMGRLYRFGGNYAASQLIGYFGNNIDTVAIGYLSNSAAAGLYGRAYQLSIGTLDQVKTPATTVAIPVLSHMRDQREKLLEAMTQGQMFLSYATLPIAAMMVAGGTPALTLVLGPDWARAGTILSILATAAALQQLATVASWAFVASGSASEMRNYTVVSTALKASAVLLSAQFGPLAVAISYTCAIALAWPLAIRWSMVAAGLPTPPLLIQGMRLFIVGAMAALVGSAAQGAVATGDELLRVVLAVAGVLGTYALAALTPVVRRDVAQLTAGVRLATRRSPNP